MNCSTCGKEFANKSSLSKHAQRKNPCKAPSILIQTVLEKAGIPSEPLTEFREASTKFNKSMTKEDRLDQGIFFTPKKARDILFKQLAELNITPSVILEPSFGTGEFLLDAKRLYPSATLLGVEKNEDLFKSLTCPGASLTCCDFLEWKGKADLIIGNPPYFVVKNTTKNSSCMTGRPNIYVLFLHKCLTEHLSPKGFLAFIIPTSLYNCSYYQPMRDYIQKHTTIHYLETLNKPGFYETGQETMLIILQNTKLHDNYIYKPSDNIYISPFYKELQTISENSVTLRSLGLASKTGNIVWNQIKDSLSENPDHTLLIYASNISDCKLTINNLKGGQKKQYVKDSKKPTLDGPVILIERGYGNSFSFNSVLVHNKKFYAENHVNVIYPTTPDSAKNLERVLKSFQDSRTLDFARKFCGNGTISSTDLETIIPIF
jgi:adenine-specific DNA-methyltransferase